MSAVPQPFSDQHQPPNKTDSAIHATFLKYLPAVATHASIKFRHLPEHDREEMIAEATAAAFVNVHPATRGGNGHRLKPSMVARFATLHAQDGRHVGGSADSKTDVMSYKAQRLRGFRVVGLPWDSQHVYDCLKDPSSPVWREVLLDDKSTPVPDQAAFRVDWSDFLRQQHDRTRKTLAMLAQGHKQVEVAGRLGVTPAAVCQRVKRAEREWMNLQGVDMNNSQPEPAQRAYQSS